MKLRYSDISFERPPSGWLVLSALVNGYLVTRKYGGYSKREAARLFIEEANEGNK